MTIDKTRIDYDFPVKWNYHGNSHSVASGNNMAFREYFSGFTYYYSFDTLVAFEHVLSGMVVRSMYDEPDLHSNTTSKHLNSIDGGSAGAKNKRMSIKRLFLKALEDTNSQHRANVIKLANYEKQADDKHMRDTRLAERMKANNGYTKAGH